MNKTRTEKQALLNQLQLYTRSDAAKSMTLQQYQRLVSWLNGMSFTEIAQEEAISPQAVSQSVSRDIRKIEAYILSSHVS